MENSGNLDCTYHYYYKGQSIIEVRNGSDAVIKQYVWDGAAGGYIDDLVQVAVNGDPADDPDFNPSDPDHDFRGYWAMHDANYDVEGLVDSSGDLVERYTYTPYGQRQVFFSPGTNDPKDYAGTLMSRRVEVTISSSDVTEPYGLNPFGHQGLHHDETTGLIYNRARMYEPRIGTEAAMKFAFIKEHRDRWPVTAMCRVLKVSRSGYHAWVDRPMSGRALRRVELAAKIKAVHQANRRVYGSPRVRKALEAQGEKVCVNTVAKVMKAHEIRAKTAKRFTPRTTDSNHRQPVAANVLDRNFTADAPNQKWAVDITYIPTDEGWLYRLIMYENGEHHCVKCIGATTA